MSWDPSGADFSSGAQTSFDQPSGGDAGGYGERPPRPEPTEEQLAHRNYNWASNRARYEFNENAVDDQGRAVRDSELEKELFEENSSEQQTQLDFSKYEKIPVRVERGAPPPPIRTVRNRWNKHVAWTHCTDLFVVFSLMKLTSTPS